MQPNQILPCCYAASWNYAVFLFLVWGLQSWVNGFMSFGLVSTGTCSWSPSKFLNPTSMLALFLSPTPTHQYADLVVGLFASAKMAGGSCLSCRPGAGNRNQTSSLLIDTFPSSMQVGLEPLFVVVTMCWVLDTMGVRCSFSAAMSLLPVLTWDGFCQKQSCAPPFFRACWCNFNSSVKISHLYFCICRSGGFDGWSLQLFVVFECG